MMSTLLDISSIHLPDGHLTVVVVENQVGLAISIEITGLNRVPAGARVH